MLITIDDVRSRGYDLLADGRLNQGDFATIEDSANQFIEECCDMIWGVIVKHRGVKWCEEFKQDMLRDDLNDIALLYKSALKKAMLEQVVFIYENGDISANAIKDDTKRSLSPKALNKLYAFGIIRF
jgi:hypothetical protein